MKYKIEYQETIKKINSVDIEVKDENDGEEIADKLCDIVGSFEHPDDIFDILDDMGVKIVETNEGAEYCEYQIQ